MRITFLGDVMITKEQLDSYKSNGKYNFYPSVESISREYSKSDLIIANLETPIAGEDKKYTYKKYSFNSPIELPMTLKDVGIDIVTTANNHCLDRDEEGLVQTIYNLQLCGIESIGTHDKKEDSFVIKEIDGIKVGILSFTYGTNAFANGNYLQKGHEYMVDLLQRQELGNPLIRKLWTSNCYLIRIVRAVARKLKIGQFNVPVYERREKNKNEIKHYMDAVKKCKDKGADYIVACLHIGGQYNSEPTDYTKYICNLSREIGVNAVIANHEHVIHGIDWENISDTSFCVYSLGNFLSSSGVICEPYDKTSEYSLAVNIDLHRDMLDNRIKADYSFEIFCNRLDEKGRVISEPLIDHINQCENINLKKKLMDDYNILMNKIYGSKEIFYPLEREHSVNYYGR